MAGKTSETEMSALHANGDLKDQKTDKEKKIVFLQRFAAFLVLLVIALIIALIVVAVQTNKTSPTTTRTKKLRHECSSKYQISMRSPEDSIFHDLTERELREIRDFMLARTELNLTKYEDAVLLDNLIFSIEFYSPNKKDAVNYLETKTNKPPRRGKVTVFYGANRPPYITEYIVQLPSPKIYTIFKQNGLPEKIPFYARPITMIGIQACNVLLRRESKKLENVLKESFAGYFHANCTDKCIQMTFNGEPGTQKENERIIWFTAQLYEEGSVILPLDFMIGVEHASPDYSQWTTKIYYNNVVYNTSEELLAMYPKNKVKFRMPTKEELLRATSRPRGKPMFKQPKVGTVPIDVQGRRFSISGNKITYGKWSTELASRATGGAIQMYNTRFEDRRIAYEISIQEALAFYSGYNIRSANTQFLDAGLGFGTGYSELQLGADCPENSVLLDVVTYFDTGKPLRNRNAVCVFEWNLAIPMRRHVEYRYPNDMAEDYWFYSGAADRALVIRTITTPYNYDYVVDFIFHQTGVIECKVSSSGYIQSGVYSKEEDSYGFNLLHDMFGPIHDHMILFKVDLDVDGTENTFTTFDVSAKNESFVWGNPGEYRIKKHFVKNERKKELDARIHYNFDEPKIYTILNKDKTNDMGNHVGYRIHPVSLVKQLYPENYLENKKTSWSNYQIAVTKESDSEKYGSSMFNMRSGGTDPLFDWRTYGDDNEDIAQKDLVAWVTVGGLHIPTAEDVPSTVTTANGFTFFLRPFNFFDEDPSLSSRDGVFIYGDEDAKFTVDTFGKSNKTTCPVVQANYGYDY